MLRATWKKDAGALLLLVLAAVLFFWPVLLGGRTIWFRDAMCADYPMAWMLADGWRSGDLPFWDPSLGIGYPFGALPHSVLLSPMGLIFAVVPLPRAYNVFVVAHVLVGGGFTYLLLRRWGLSIAAAGLGGAALMFSGYVVTVTSLTSFLRGLCWMPAALLAFDGWLARGRPSSIAATALVFAVSGCGNDPHFLIHTGFLVACARWLRPGTPGISLGRTVAGLAGVALLSGLLLCVVYVPLAELVMRSDRSRGLNDDELAAYAVSPFSLLNVLLPLGWPDPESPHHLLSFPSGVVPLVHNLYWGAPLAALTLAALGWAWPFARREPDGPGASQTPDEPDAGNPPLGGAEGFGKSALTASVLVFLSIGVSLGNNAPFWRPMLAVAPFLRIFRYPSKYWVVAALCMPLLAALGFEGLLRRRSGVLGGFTAALVLLLTLGAGSLFWLSHNAWDFTLAFFTKGPRTSMPRPAVEAVAGHWAPAVWGLLAVTLLLLVLDLLRRRGALRHGLWLAGVAALALGDLASTTFHGTPAMLDAEIAGEPPLARAMREDHRLAHPADPCPPRFSTYVEIPMVYEPDRTVATLYREFRGMLVQMMSVPFGVEPVLAMLSLRLPAHNLIYEFVRESSQEDVARLLACLGTSYAIRLDLPDRPPLGQLVARDGKAVLERLAEPRPRAFLAQPGKTPEAPDAISTGAALQTIVSARPDPALGACRIATRTRNRVELQLEVRADARCVILDSYYPGWIAQVDGQPRAIEPVGGTFRAVLVHRGDRRLEMRYAPRSRTVGALLTALGMLIALGLVVRSRKDGSPRNPGSQEEAS